MEDYERARRDERAAKRLKMRTSRGQTQPEVAEAIGVTLRAFQKWQAGGGMHASNLRKLSAFWGVPISELRDDEDTMTAHGLATSADVARLEQRIEDLQSEIIRLLVEGQHQGQTGGRGQG